jgi:transcriptional regulator GlxA family with amidase domain
MVNHQLRLRQLLVHWEAVADSKALWEDMAEFQRRYPTIKVEDELPC